jgi:hypothetical protein
MHLWKTFLRRATLGMEESFVELGRNDTLVSKPSSWREAGNCTLQNVFNRCAEKGVENEPLIKTG